MENIYLDFKALHHYCKENNIAKEFIFTNSCVICNTPFASIYKQVNTCSNNCATSLITLEKNIALAAIKADKEKWCLDSLFKVGNDNIIIVATTFNLKEIANGKTKFNYVVRYKESFFRINNIPPLKKYYENLDAFNNEYGVVTI
jgi:hypothetical protein